MAVSPMFDPDVPRSADDLAARPVAAPATNPATASTEAATPIDASATVFRTTGPTNREREAFALLKSIWSDIEAFEHLLRPDRPPSDADSRAEAATRKPEATPEP